MCTVVVHVGPDGVALAANRDEVIARAWDPPAGWWPDHPGIVGGRDRDAGGTWLAWRFGPDGAVDLAAAVLNRPGTLGPAIGKRSRGALPLLALTARDGAAASELLGRQDARAWRSFNMVVADRTGAWFARGAEAGRPDVRALGPGVHMTTAHDPDSPDSPRTVRHLPRFRSAAPPTASDWAAWRTLLADDTGPAATELCVPERGGFGTVCAAMLFLTPGSVRGGGAWFAPGPPSRTAFARVVAA